MLTSVSSARVWESPLAAQSAVEAERAPGRRQPSTPDFPGLPTHSADEVELSLTAQKLAKAPGEQEPDGRAKDAGAADPAEELTSEQQREVEQLKERDREVRAHEQAHVAASGGLARGGAKFEYKSGPDGKQYAIGGEVQIDTSPVSGDPAATLRKAEQIRRAAMAPADPSGQDRAVAAEATRMAAEARQELAQQNKPAAGAAQGYAANGKAAQAAASSGAGRLDISA